MSSAWSYLSPCLIVVQVHQPPRVLLNFPGIHEAAGELHAVLDVGRAAPPLPALLVVAVEALLLPVTPALAQVTLAAGLRHCVRHSRRHNGVCERRLPAAWKEENRHGFCCHGNFREREDRCRRWKESEF